MNTHASIKGTSGRDKPSRAYRYLVDPRASDRAREGARADFHANTPRLDQIGPERQILEAILAGKQHEIDRYYKVKASTDLTLQTWDEASTASQTLFDRIQLRAYVVVSAVGICAGINTLAQYVEASGVLPGLDGNYLGSLLLSLPPLSGAFALKAVGDHLSTDRGKRRYHIALGAVGISAMLISIVAMSITFGPKPDDMQAAVDALSGLASAHSPASASDAEGLLSRIVLASGLIAEMFLAPVVMSGAIKLNHAKHKMVVTPHPVQTASDEAIEEARNSIAQKDQQIADLNAEEEDLQRRGEAEVEKAAAEFEVLRRNIERVATRVQKTQSKQGGTSL